LAYQNSEKQKYGTTISKYPDIYGEVNSVKNTTINVWLNDGVY